ncbi:MAG: UPF0158 family protein, partial [Pseudomonadota bacterium]
RAPLGPGFLIIGMESKEHTKILWLDAEEIIMAMRDQSAEWLLDPISGRLCLDPHESHEWFDEEEVEAWRPSDPKQQLPLPFFTSSDGFRLMESFALDKASSEAREILQAALALRKPFRQFKDALCEFADDRRRWFEFEADAMKRVAENFYAAEGYTVRWIESPADPKGLL